jgi:hypothetical protein
MNAGLCALYSFKAQVELKARINGADGGWFHDNPLDHDDMLKKYEAEPSIKPVTA